MITALLIGAGILYAIRKRPQGLLGIGATKRQKRRIWAEVEQAQRAGIDLTDPNGWEKHADTLRRMSQGKLPASKSDKPDEQRYFNQLRRAYKSISGTGLQPKQSVIYNEYGDVVLVYNDYELDKLPEKAADYVYDENIVSMSTNPYDSAYWATIASIASGVKFVWASSNDKTKRGVEQMVFGQKAQAERKQRISYLATPEKGGVYIDKFAHRLWEASGQTGDDKDITDGVIEAIRATTSVGAAREACIDYYMQAHQISEPALYQDVPF